MNTTESKIDTKADLGFNHRFLAAPDNPDGMTLLLLHGTGGNENDMLEIGRTLMPNAHLLGVRGKVLESGMPRFFRRFAEGVFDEEDVRFRSGELADFVQKASETYSLGKIITVGYSNGANIAGAMLLLNPGVLSGAVLLRAMPTIKPDVIPDLDGVPVFLGQGRHDPIAPPELTDRLSALLTEANAAVTVAYQDTGHNLTQNDLTAAQEWLRLIKL